MRGHHRARTGRLAAGGVVVAAVALAAACGSPEQGASPPRAATEGIPERGRTLIEDYGCGSCHVVPGVDEADGLVGPPLDSFARRSYIAGQLPNTEANLQRWVQDPDDVEDGTAMPDLDITETEAAHITAYLYTLD